MVEIGTDTKFGKVVEVLSTAKVLHDGWEMDNAAWLVRFENKSLAILTTSHGHLYVAEKSEFEDKLKETEKSADSIRNLLVTFNDQLSNCQTVLLT